MYESAVLIAGAFKSSGYGFTDGEHTSPRLPISALAGRRDAQEY